jgi:putative ABC transport system permease protein
VALGSTRASILRMVLREGLELVVIGLMLGLAGAALMQRAVASEMYGVRPLDPLVLLSAMAVLTIVALAACAVPARRAMRVDPMVALRSE